MNAEDIHLTIVTKCDIIINILKKEVKKNDNEHVEYTGR